MELVESGLTALKQPVVLDRVFQWGSRKSESSAAPGLIGVWFHTTERVFGTRNFEMGLCVLAAGLDPFGPESTS